MIWIAEHVKGHKNMLMVPLEGMKSNCFLLSQYHKPSTYKIKIISKIGPCLPLFNEILQSLNLLTRDFKTIDKSKKNAITTLWISSMDRYCETTISNKINTYCETTIPRGSAI